MVRTTLAFLILGLLASPVPPPGAGAAPQGRPVTKVENEDFKDVRRIINDAIRQKATPSVSVAVSHGGKIIWLESVGWANGPQRVRATPHTAYPIGSITKPMTATAIMMLAERGEIDIGKPAEKYLEDFKFTAYKGKSKNVTIKHLLNHTSGLPLHFNYFFGDDVYDPPDFLETFERYGILVHPPGAVFQYSDLGYEVLGRMIAETSGMPYEEFMRKEVFEPLGMTGTWVGFESEYAGMTAQTYDADFKPLPHVTMDTPAAGAVFSTAYCLLRFGMFHLKNNLPSVPRIITNEAIDAMQSDVDRTVSRASEDLYGLGWFSRENDHGYRTVWHEGGVGGAKSMLKLVPSENIAVVVLMNIWSDDLPGRITDEILGVLLPEYKENRGKGEIPASPRFEPYKATPDLTGQWKGEIKTYSGDIPVYMVFQEDGDIHFMKALDVDRTATPQEQDYFDRVLSNAGVLGSHIHGRLDMRIPTPDAARESHTVELDVVRDGKRMSGSVSALSAGERMYYGLSYYISLEKQD